jgi:hypothetical protein
VGAAAMGAARRPAPRRVTADAEGKKRGGGRCAGRRDPHVSGTCGGM